MRPSALIAILCGTALAQALSGCILTPAPPVLPPVPERGKITVALGDIPNVRIELPDESFHDFGSDLQARLSTQLTESNRYIVVDEALRSGSKSSFLELQGDDDYHWQGSITPVATIRVKTEELSFVTGARGGRMFYGFNRHFRTPYNSGESDQKNDFPLRSVTFEPNWFDRSFDRKGSESFGSQSGLDLGEGFELNVLFAYFRIKYARYETGVGLNVEIDAPLAAKHEIRQIDVQGKGYFYDVVGGYLQYSGGIRVARSDAMDQAMKNAFDGSFQAINRGLRDLPLVAKIDAVVPGAGAGKPDILLLGTGPNSGVKAGTVYSAVTDPSVQIAIDKSVASGSIGHLIAGDPALAKPGLLIRESGVLPETLSTPKKLGALTSSTVPTVADTVSLPDTNLPKSDLSAWVPEISKAQAILKSIQGVATLAYRAWRYYHYDQDFQDPNVASRAAGRDDSPNGMDRQAPDPNSSQDVVTLASVTGPSDWADQAKKQAWARQIGLDRAGEMPELGLRSPVVAILDSGVDYNHPAINEQVWWNPQPQYGDTHGYDFISGDSNPYDDSYHGTQIASAVLAVAPRARIMPVKIFNPWGITSSAAVFAAFQYAVDHGANIIVCGWATRKNAQAIEEGVAYARKRNVLVVASAGDRGEFLTEAPTFPGSLSKIYDNVMTVTGVDSGDQLVGVKGKAANFGSKAIEIAAPGQDIQVAEPRGRVTKETGTGIAAAIAAGAVARNLAHLGPATGDPAQWISQLQSQADRLKTIDCFVKEGYRLRIAR